MRERVREVRFIREPRVDPDRAPSLGGPRQPLDPGRKRVVEDRTYATKVDAVMTRDVCEVGVVRLVRPAERRHRLTKARGGRAFFCGEALRQYRSAQGYVGPRSWAPRL